VHHQQHNSANSSKLTLPRAAGRRRIRRLQALQPSGRICGDRVERPASEEGARAPRSQLCTRMRELQALQARPLVAALQFRYLLSVCMSAGSDTCFCAVWAIHLAASA
jgi:hypothetical protein